ncbi:MAG: DUF6702 family protein, partial [Planctomycetota bacterium]
MSILVTPLNFVFLFAATFVQHPEHVSLAEIEYNTDSKVFEVAIRVCAEDLNWALSAEKMRAKATAKFIDRFAPEYIEKHFRIRNSGSPDTSEKNLIRWHGHEAGEGECWLYFEYTGVMPEGEWIVENRLFVDLHPNQTNQIRFQLDNEVVLRITTSV